jgi:hypothetical protein
VIHRWRMLAGASHWRRSRRVSKTWTFVAFG